MRIEFGTAESVELPTATPATASKKNGWLPVLVVLFLISYALMTMLIVEQGRTIDSQRALIRELFRDSTELAAARTKAQDGRAQAAQSKPVGTKNPSSQNQASQNQSAQSTQSPAAQTQSNQTPSTQAPAKRHPSSQAGTQNRAQNEAAKPKAFQMPTKPASDLVDADRSLILI